MKVYGYWYGGASYREPHFDTDLELFPSMEAAKDALLNRFAGCNYMTEFYYVYATAGRESATTPCVGLDSEIHIYFTHPFAGFEDSNRDPYPDRIIKFGPRGGVRVEIA